MDKRIADPILACAPTGSGKTVAFLLSVLRDLKGSQRKLFRVMILVRMSQSHRKQRPEDTSHQQVGPMEQKFCEKSNKKYEILVSDTNRVYYFCRVSWVEWFVVDEADKLLEDYFKDPFD